MKEINSSHEFNRAPEYGARGREFSRSRENNPEVGKNDGGREQNTSSAKEPRRKKRSVADRIRRAMVCVAGAAVVTVAIILPANGPKAEFTGLSVTDTSISYEIEVPKTGMQVTLVAENDFTRREAALSVGPNFGTIEGLVPGMSYSLKVVGKSGVISLDMAQKSVTTDTVAPVTALYSVESECKCNVDGYFYFTMHFADENGWWSGFEATLTDMYGTASECSFTEDAHEEQRIEVGSEFKGNTATLVITCLSTENAPEGERVTLYETEVKI